MTEQNKAQEMYQLDQRSAEWGERSYHRLMEDIPEGLYPVDVCAQAVWSLTKGMNRYGGMHADLLVDLVKRATEEAQMEQDEDDEADLAEDEKSKVVCDAILDNLSKNK